VPGYEASGFAGIARQEHVQSGRGRYRQGAQLTGLDVLIDSDTGLKNRL